jgi:sugar phosphate isomerase/epimerase
MSTQIACQMYTLREFTKTPADIARALSRVRGIGYAAVQLSALGPIDPHELSKILDGEGLAVCATHVSMDRLRNDRHRVIEEHQLWKCRYTALGMYRSEAHTAMEWSDFAREFGGLARAYSASGVRVGYHNHSHELARCDDGAGKTALQLLVDELPAAAWFEIDTYWIAHGGGDPVEWIGKVAGRIPCVHLKDMAVSPKREQFMAEVGEGNLNWPGIIGACRRAGVEWYIIEQDICRRDPFESIAISLRNLQSMGLH